MHCLAAIALDGFYIQALRKEGLNEDCLLVVLQNKAVLDATPSSRARGVLEGQSEAESRAILGKEGKFQEWKEGQFTAASEQWLDLVSEFSATIEPSCEHRALVDLSGHPDPARTLEDLKAALEQLLGIPVKVGLGASRWVAEASCTDGPVSMAALLAPRRFIASYSTLRMEPIEWKDRERLMALGYRTIGDVATLSYSTLVELFGTRAFLIAQAAKGSGDPRIEQMYPMASRAALHCFECAPDNWEDIAGVGVQLSKKLGEALSKEDLIAYDVEIVTTEEQGARQEMHRSFTAPLKTARCIERAISLMLTEPFPNPVERILVRLRKLEKPQRVQRTLDNMVKGAERTESLDHALKSLKATFGAHAVERAGALPVARSAAVRRAWQEANGWTWR